MSNKNKFMSKVDNNIYTYLVGTSYSASEFERQQGKEAYLISISVKGTRKTRRIVGTLDEARKIRDSLKLGMEVGLTTVKKRTSTVKKTISKQTTTAILIGESSWSLGYAYKKTVELAWKETAAERTQSLNAKQALSYFGESTKLDDISREDIDDYIDFLKSEGNSNGTINRKLSALSKMFTIALERKKCKEKLSLPRLREAEHRIRYLSEREEETLLNILNKKGYTDHAEAALILLYTGFRTSELWNLQCKDIDLKNKLIFLWKTKNGRPRSVPIVDKIYPIIKRRYENVNGEGRIFSVSSNAWFRNVWDRAREIMGLSDDKQFVPHMLRHTCATRLSQKGVNLIIIKEWLGHTSIATTSRYTHFSKEELVQAGKLLVS